MIQRLRTTTATLFCWTAGVLMATSATDRTVRAADEVRFASQIQPLLARRCAACHGPDTAEGGLRFNEPATANTPRESGRTAVVAGRPESSELIRRITSEDPELRMPPEGKPLSENEARLLRQWISEGGEFEAHWSFEPVRRVTPPKPQAASWVRTPIDAFILADLEKHGFTPSAPEEPRALLRRLSYDLTGLPPTIDESNAFVNAWNANADAAYSEAVERYLSSDRYGEKWARHWLDVVRYAETNSFERDGPKPHAWRYRDYVIRSFNSDKPYDQFVKEQLAGDELYPESADALVATGFYRLGLWDDEPADRELAMYDGFDDMVTTTGQAFLGLTINCARCHDHKIDPIPAADYYSLVAFFRNITPNGYENPNTVRPIFPNPGDRERYAAAVAALQSEADRIQIRVSALESEFVQQAKIPEVAIDDLDDLVVKFYRDSFEQLPNFDDLKPETVSRPTVQLFDIRSATRDENFGFMFTGVLKVPQDGDYTFQIDSDDGTRLTIDGMPVLLYDGIHGTGNPQEATVSLKAGRRAIRLDYFQGYGGKGLMVAWSGPGMPKRFLSATSAEGVDLAALKNVKGKDRRAAKELIRTLARDVLGAEKASEYERLVKELEQIKQKKPWNEYALCVTEHGPHPLETRVLRRGSPQAPGDLVQPAFLKALGGGLAEAGAGAVLSDVSNGTVGLRRRLAEWIASGENCMTARVMINRVWQHHFGRGIVRSANNFGQLGDPPTHPELLDWLAGDFVQGGWTLKRMHRQIVLSNVYRQSSRGRPDAMERDPANDRFWRFNPRRLSGEEVRDSVLAATGQLNLAMYGPSVYPKISEEVLAGQSVPGKGWPTSQGADQHRRSVYVHVKRSLTLPLLASFDFPETDVSCEGRFNTTQPGQALAMLNGEFLNDAARVLAERVKREAGDDVDRRLERTIQTVVARPAQRLEIDRLRALVNRLTTEHGQSIDVAMKYAGLTVLNWNEFLNLD